MNQHEPQILWIAAANKYSSISAALADLYTTFLTLSERDRVYSYIRYGNVIYRLTHRDGSYLGVYPIGDNSSILNPKLAMRIAVVNLYYAELFQVQIFSRSGGVTTGISFAGDSDQTAELVMYLNK